MQLKLFCKNIGDVLKHPLQNDYPAWKLLAVCFLVACIAYWIIDNSRAFAEMAKDTLS